MTNAITKDITEVGLQISTIGQFIKLTKGQAALLKAMRDCVKEGKAISWDILVDIFYNNVSKISSDYRWVGGFMNGHKEYFDHDIMECYKSNNSQWLYSIRPRVRQWFVSTIGILVIKNQLIVIPTIDINE